MLITVRIGLGWAHGPAASTGIGVGTATGAQAYPLRTICINHNGTGQGGVALGRDDASDARGCYRADGDGSESPSVGGELEKHAGGAFVDL